MQRNRSLEPLVSLTHPASEEKEMTGNSSGNQMVQRLLNVGGNFAFTWIDAVRINVSCLMTKRHVMAQELASMIEWERIKRYQKCFKKSLPRRTSHKIGRL